MTKNDIIIEVRHYRQDKNTISISVHNTEYKNIIDSVLIPFERYESVGLVQSLTFESKKFNNPIHSHKCEVLLGYISAGATIRINCNIK